MSLGCNVAKEGIEPVGPTMPDGPVDPVEPTLPDTPVGPVKLRPVGPVEPEGPVEPVVPTPPDAPVMPVGPVRPTAPVVPIIGARKGALHGHVRFKSSRSDADKFILNVYEIGGEFV